MPRNTLKSFPTGMLRRGLAHFHPASIAVVQPPIDSPREPPGNSYGISDGAPPQVLRLDTQSTHMASYVQGLRAILGGDDKLLGQVFDTRPAGSFDSWRVTLLPKGPPPRRGIRQIVVTGNAGHVQQIETTEVNGDIQLMMITTR